MPDDGCSRMCGPATIGQRWYNEWNTTAGRHDMKQGIGVANSSNNIIIIRMELR